MADRHLVDTVPYRLPSPRMKTKSLRKAYNRVRRRHPGFTTVPSKTAYMVGGKMVMHPGMLEGVRRASEKLTERVVREQVGGFLDGVKFSPGAPTAGGISRSSLMESLRRFPDDCARVVEAGRTVFFNTADWPVVHDPEFRFSTREYEIPNPSLLTNTTF